MTVSAAIVHVALGQAGLTAAQIAKKTSPSFILMPEKADLGKSAANDLAHRWNGGTERKVKAVAA